MSRKTLFACAATCLLSALSAPVQAQSPVGGAPLFAVLNGGNECNGAGVCRQGDLDAIGSATITFVANAGVLTGLCYAITVDNLAGATAAHIHFSPSGLNGPIVVPLPIPPAAPGGGDPGASSGCIAVPAGTLQGIRSDPTRFYVNVHNAAFPNGAVRGQLH